MMVVHAQSVINFIIIDSVVPTDDDLNIQNMVNNQLEKANLAQVLKYE